MAETKLICVKVGELRKIGYDSLEKWLENPNHVYIGRACVYVKGTYDSKWKNPYPVKKYGRDECLRMYLEYVEKNESLMNDLDELRGKTLGCWCCHMPRPERCHGDILIDLLNKKLN